MMKMDYISQLQNIAALNDLRVKKTWDEKELVALLEKYDIPLPLDQQLYSIFNLIQGFDPFAFDQYPQDYKLLSKYFEGPELYIRLASWLLYKYTWLKSEGDRKALDEQVGRTKNKERSIAALTESYLPDSMIAYWYLHFNPSLATIKQVNLIAERYRHHLAELWRRLYKKYVGN